MDGSVPAGVAAAVEIRRDRFGVPNITAASDRDAWFGLGFCQGQDRAFQIETRVRVVRGTLAALVGGDGLPIDRLSRRVGFARYGAAEARKMAVPLVPFLSLGAIVALFLGERVLDAYLALF